MEAITGERFDEWMRNNLFVYLGISGGFNIYELEHIDRLAVLYRNGIAQSDNYGGVNPAAPNWDEYVPGENAILFSPQGGLRISSKDLAKFLEVLIGGTYTIGSDIVNILGGPDDMVDPVWTFNGTNGNNYYGLFNEWGLGVHSITNTPGEDVVLEGLNMKGHPGEAYGLLSDFYIDTDSPYGFAFMTNGYYPGGSYEWGNQSSFYTVEEAVFEALESDYQSCKLTSIKEVPLDETAELLRITDQLGRVVVNPQPGQILFYWYDNGRVEKKIQWVE